MGTCVFAVVLLYRRITSIGRLSKWLWGGVLVTVAWVISAGVTHFHAAQAFDFPPGAFTPSTDFFTGLGAALLVTTYDYWGYYNICYLAGEVEKPERNVPRAVMISVGLVAAIYLLMNVSVLGVIPWQQLAGADERKRALLGDLRLHAADLWRLGRQAGHAADYLDGLRLGFFAAAGIFARALCRRARRQLFRGLWPPASAAQISLRFAAGAGQSWRRRSAFCSWPT